ncbi:long-subunit fatty acid transport protein [Paracoccus pantotrophus]|uniref:Aromatic hydrocarbon degradation protein n=1 Tax=Paracoccus pantotrophus TaxID=82367 RepID=A0AAE6NVC1_PARPN|nr:outer membrane protein transport protein [Paracoccus pantotrophus]QFG36994.1 aromatic hydrocarbon degradation protein [Paracoccus pantotrophus]RKS52589.1 long-subunit fatty acid transport protein [Paracoccus pantotrophus]
MKRIVTGIGALLASAAPVLAGGIERAPQSLAPLFESGNYLELSFGGVNPDVSGRDLAVYGGAPTGDVAQGYGFFGLAYKHQFNENLSGALIVEQPFGADVLYPTANSPVLGGTRVEVNSTTYTALLRYKFDNNFSVHGGIRGSHADGQLSLRGLGYKGPPPAGVSGYDLDIDGAWGIGWVAGVAYEMPEIAARVSLTYNSPIEHDFDMKESFSGTPIAASGSYEVKTPRSWTLEGQTGIAADTLLFGSIRWVKWSEFRVDNFFFPTQTGAELVEVEDTTTYTIGVGRKFTDNWSGSVSFLYEPSEGDTVSPLAPVNGRKAVTVAAIYTMDNIKITTGINYTKLGNATLGVGPSGNKTEVARMDDSEAWAIAMRIGYSF